MSDFNGYYIVKVRLQKGGQWRSVGLKYGPGEDVPQMTGHFESPTKAKTTASFVRKTYLGLYDVAVFHRGRIFSKPKRPNTAGF